MDGSVTISNNESSCGSNEKLLTDNEMLQYKSESEIGSNIGSNSESNNESNNEPNSEPNSRSISNSENDCLICAEKVDALDYGKIDDLSEKDICYHITCLDRWIRANKRCILTQLPMDHYHIFRNGQFVKTLYVDDEQYNQSNGESGDVYIDIGLEDDQLNQPNQQNNQHTSCCSVSDCICMALIVVILYMVVDIFF
jgi:hypothetical protein